MSPTCCVSLDKKENTVEQDSRLKCLHCLLPSLFKNQSVTAATCNIQLKQLFRTQFYGKDIVQHLQTQQSTYTYNIKSDSEIRGTGMKVTWTTMETWRHLNRFNVYWWEWATACLVECWRYGRGMGGGGGWEVCMRVVESRQASGTECKLFLGLFPSHFVDLSGPINMGDGGGQLDVFSAGGSTVTYTHTHTHTNHQNQNIQPSHVGPDREAAPCRRLCSPQNFAHFGILGCIYAVGKNDACIPSPTVNLWLENLKDLGYQPVEPPGPDTHTPTLTVKHASIKYLGCRLFHMKLLWWISTSINTSSSLKREQNLERAPPPIRWRLIDFRERFQNFRASCFFFLISDKRWMVFIASWYRSPPPHLTVFPLSLEASPESNLRPTAAFISPGNLDPSQSPLALPQKN